MWLSLEMPDHFPTVDEALTEGLDEQFQIAISNDARPEQTPVVRENIPMATNHLLKLGICLSACRDLNSGPSVPQITEICPRRLSGPLVPVDSTMCV